MIEYGSYTYNSPSFLKRLVSGSRFELAADLVRGEVLDYGCCDAHFSEVLAARGIRSVTNYEPYANCAPKNGIPYIGTLKGLSSQFDTIACLEVLEHISAEKLDEFFADVRRLLKPNGKVVISVPVMLGPAGLFKMAYYLNKRPGYTLTNAFRHFVGWMPERLHVDGIYDHDGFDYRKLRERLFREFRHVKQHATPFAKLPAWLNSQVFFVCEGVV